MEVMKMKFEKYEAYKDSGEAWLGEIPRHWQALKLKHIFNEKRIKHNSELGCGAISFGTVVEKDDEKIPLSTKASYQEVLEGEFLVNPLNLNYDLKSLRIALSGINVVVSSGYIVLQNHEKIDKSYYKYLLHRYDVAYMKLLGSGVRQTISFNHISNSLLASPPLPEQTAIAQFLDDKTAKIDQAIAQKEQLIELLKERKQILIQELVTGKKVWSSTDSDHGEWITPKETVDSGVEWIGKIPKGWEVIPSKFCLSIPITDGPHTTPLLIDNGIPFISAEAIKNGSIDFDKRRGDISIKDHQLFSQKYKTKRGDIYMVKSGATTGNIAMVETDEEFSIWSPLAVFRAEKSKIIDRFLYRVLESPYFKKGVELKWSFGTQQNIGMGVLSNLPIALPSMVEQENIVKEILILDNKISESISLQQTQIKKLKEYKSVLIDSAVKGKLRVPQFKR